MHVFLAEKEAELRERIVTDVRAWGHEIDAAENGDMALQFILDHHDAYNLLIIDTDLPILSGEEICRRIRSEFIQTPVLMLVTLNELKEEGGVRECGADDYLVKPFSPEELRLRMSTLAERYMRFAPSEITHHDFTLRVRERSIQRGTTSINLTPRETALLEYLMLRPGKAIGRQELFVTVWGKDSLQESNLVDVHIKNLRKKIRELDPEEKDLRIETVRGLGYVLTP